MTVRETFAFVAALTREVGITTEQEQARVSEIIHVSICDIVIIISLFFGDKFLILIHFKYFIKS